MKVSPRDEKKPKRPGLAFGVVFLALFFTGTLPPPAANAVTITASPTDDANNDLLFAQLTAAATGLFAALQAAERYLMTEGFSGVIADVTSMAAVQIKALELTTNGKIAADYARSQAAGAAVLQGQSVMPNKSRACAVIQYEQAREHLGQRDNLGNVLRRLFMGMCKGPNADCSGPVLKQKIVNDLCKLGFIPQDQYGTLTSNCAPPKNPAYNNLAGNISYLLNLPQLQMATGCIQNDGYISFDPAATGCQNNARVDVGDASGGTDPTQDKSLWAGMALICMLANLPTSSPVSRNGTPTPDDYLNIAKDQELMALQGGAQADPCFKALGERTACDATVNFQTPNGTETCHQDQVAACLALSTDPNPNGDDYSGSQGGGEAPKFPANGTQVGLGYTSDPKVQNNCQNGLSEMGNDQILSHCTDVNAMVDTVNEKGTNDALGNLAEECRAKADRYKSKIEQEAQSITAMFASALATMNNEKNNLTAPSMGR